MAKYRVTQVCFIADTLVEAGKEIEFAGVPNSSMEPLDDEAKRAVVERDAKLQATATGIAAAVSGTVDAALVETINALGARLAVVEARSAATAADVSELDVGLDLVTGRMDSVEGVIGALAKAPVKKPVVKPVVETPVVEAPTEPPPADPVVEAPVTEPVVETPVEPVEPTEPTA